MWSTAREIAEGDTIIVWMKRDLLQPLVITPGKELNGRFGVYSHSDLIGVPYGSKVGSRNGKGFVYVLRPTPELWTLALPHRTQILYAADIAFVMAWLGIKPGSAVVEAGTGSGSFSHSVARTIGPSGRLHSFEFHETRANKARDDFERHGFKNITLKHQNVCKAGFGLKDEVDAVFLDLPAPWLAIDHAKLALRKDQTGRICCFSPCIEQVLRTVTALNDAGFTGITLYETLLRPHEVSAVSQIKIGDVAEKLKKNEAKREASRLEQIRRSGEKAEEKRKRKREANGADESGRVSRDEVVVKRTKAVEGEEMDVDVDAPLASAEVPVGDVSTMVEPSSTPVPLQAEEGEGAGADASQLETLNSAKCVREVRGHTSYLTFACLLPWTAEMAAAAAAVEDISDSVGADADGAANNGQASEKGLGENASREQQREEEEVYSDSESVAFGKLVAGIPVEELERLERGSLG
ncbi:hypothetical protein BOTBODRAFT_26869 [Botryobasidium botryosum FD-172 SS1]|uniref:tRNA (adenine(58)-N(1))-methyltransferase catalytic subunit TRM61 n=1 Tax=Botryobasidium botryosum (strain FD-172 SS1) TaxID=930990 RepID=A0A067MZ41_BOTB1|nr:hypothetical protein BOTBODRAFT_26869 [Botryobasidium botryosum FD-172 SS1]